MPFRDADGADGRSGIEGMEKVSSRPSAAGAWKPRRPASGFSPPVQTRGRYAEEGSKPGVMKPCMLYCVDDLPAMSISFVHMGAVSVWDDAEVVVAVVVVVVVLVPRR